MFKIVLDKETGVWSYPKEVMDQMIEKEQYDQRHGSAYDRGGADAYYGRRFNPHYFKGDSYASDLVNLYDPNDELYKAYAAGYQDTVDAGDFKDWG